MFKINISEPTKRAFTAIAEKINANADIEEIIDLCQSIPEAQSELRNAYIFAAVIDANRNPLRSEHLSRARKLLAQAEDHPFAHFLSRYLLEKGVFAPTASAFESTVPYDVWVATNFYRTYRTNTLGALQKFLKANPPPNDGVTPVICDIGPGNGILLNDILGELFRIYQMPCVKIVLVEMSQNMLEATVKQLTSRWGERLQCSTILGKIQDISAEKLQNETTKDGFWFIMGSASLHHLPRHLKREVLQSLATITPRLVVTDFVANHDLPEMNSPELIYSVSNFYGYILDDVWKTPSESASRKWQAICDFFLTEAIHMLTKPRLERIDYHASLELWHDVAHDAGFEPQDTTYTSFDGTRPITFTTVYYS
jgi:hypothetical protein